MNIKELKEKSKDSKSDSIIERNVELIVRLKLPFDPNDIIIEDETGTLSAITTSKEKINRLQNYALQKKKIKIKGYLAKSMFESIGFDIEEILD